MCNCIETTNRNNGELVTKHHTRLCFTIPLEQGFVPRMIIKTETTADAPKRTKAVELMASYCPFCGEKYEDFPEESNTEARP